MLVVVDEENNRGIIKVIPEKELELPVEIVQIDPEVISLLPKEQPESEGEDEKTEEEAAADVPPTPEKSRGGGAAEPKQE